ncbi:hypothetical protein KGA66_11685 [Actinocrinis puniceicyclus]|uniref:Uncharacterized protein n=1 Tax=Actinocrinis puniceicyclus TaxID=977794 RepID=A0A8J8BC35_9ACTN|nr:DUF6882 domain-containing protein [Actinocrinis puniceicyclus]MBS2963713.1 hypothetical protein [Actinocrinis puniceicyclus]
MSVAGGYSGAATGTGDTTRTTPQVYHDAVLASQQSADQASARGPAPLPPLVPPPIDPNLGSFPTPGGGPAVSQTVPRQDTETPPSGQPAGAPTFPVARVFDGVNPDGSLLINRQNLDPREIPALVAYLTRAAVALSAPGTTRDELVPGAPPNVPRVFHSDGTWIWPAAVGYYLSLHQLPPQPELLAHIRSRKYTLGPVHPEAAQAAAAQILATLNVQPVRAQGPVPPEPAPVRPTAAAVPTGNPSAALPSPAAAVTAPVAALPEFSARFNAAGNRHAAWVTEQLEAFLAFMPLGDWSVDHATRVYRQSGRQFPVDALGMLSSTGVWTWAWADPAAWGGNPEITEQARRLRALGEREGVAELTTPAFDLSGIADAPDSPQDAAEMLAWTSMGLLGARGYIGHSAEHSASPGGTGLGDARAYYVVCGSEVPNAEPRLSTVPRFVMEGAATFGEDDAECVLGYVEHYGWEWSRVPDGIVVAAEGIGSFTVEISAEGRLTGLSLHT